MFTLINTVERIAALIGRDDLDGLAWDLAAKAIDATLEADDSTGIDAARAIESVANFVEGIEDLTEEEEAEAHEAVAAGIRMIEKLRAAPRGIVLVSADDDHVYGIGTDASSACADADACSSSRLVWELVGARGFQAAAGGHAGRYQAYAVPLLDWSAEDGHTVRALGDLSGYWLSRDMTVEEAIAESKIRRLAADAADPKSLSAPSDVVREMLEEISIFRRETKDLDREVVASAYGRLMEIVKRSEVWRTTFGIMPTADDSAAAASSMSTHIEAYEHDEVVWYGKAADWRDQVPEATMLVVWFDYAAVTAHGTAAAEIQIGDDSYSVTWTTVTGEDCEVEFAPGSPSDGAVGVAWTRKDPVAAVIDAFQTETLRREAEAA